MSEPKIRRKFKAVPATLGTSVAGSSAIRWDDVAGGSILVGTSATSFTSIQLWASGTTDGTFGRVYAADGSAADITLAQSTSEARVYALPDAAYGVGAIKLVAGQAAGTAASCVVLLKT
jgi:hypothetical protein